ncbi:hypothetical protein BDN72DRAFT_864648 [Pluteus cervinus]|uniref:Uncharacterized protein n=1 Tax=Pluteus cervinus TaxID=181527 RepID=A0ACD3A315_9AGAR|nr:hypothetical protein BDN72DRAFT_864648 [Pluteus cervinus]
MVLNWIGARVFFWGAGGQVVYGVVLETRRLSDIYRQQQNWSYSYEHSLKPTIFHYCPTAARSRKGLRGWIAIDNSDLVVYPFCPLAHGGSTLMVLATILSSRVQCVKSENNGEYRRRLWIHPLVVISFGMGAGFEAGSTADGAEMSFNGGWSLKVMVTVLVVREAGVFKPASASSMLV